MKLRAAIVKLLPSSWLNPINLKRWRRFKKIRRAYASLWIICILLFLSLFTELLCNHRPLFVNCNGKWYFPVLRFYPESTFTRSEIHVEANYKKLAKLPLFTDNPKNRIIFTLHPYGPHEVIDKEDLAVNLQDVVLRLQRQPRVGFVEIRDDGEIARSQGCDLFFGRDDSDLRGQNLNELVRLSVGAQAAVSARFAGQEAPEFLDDLKLGDAGVRLKLPAAEAGSPRKRLRLYLQESGITTSDRELVFSPSYRVTRDGHDVDVHFTPRLEDLLKARFAGQSAKEQTLEVKVAGHLTELQFPSMEPTNSPPTAFDAAVTGGGTPLQFAFLMQQYHGDSLTAFPETARQDLLALVRQRYLHQEVLPEELLIDGRNYLATVTKEDVNFPFRPVYPDHPLGFDSSGKDVLSIIIYAFRLNMLFGILLVLFSEALGVVIGAIQGYKGGMTDLLVQRYTEVWSALPFLYIIILVGSVYGRSFVMLLVVYTIFHWIGISYYMRGEFLRLRRQPFVEAARCIGLPTRTILFGHILPNALVPLITFIPFSLVGAIGILTALDYLGYGLPPLSPSWGTLLAQAQDYKAAWWLTLYPSLALFLTMLLCVFIGEGVREAFDPRKFTRYE